MRFLFLYTEIAEYFIACCNQLTEHGDVHIIRWPVNKEAPFNFSENNKLKIYSKTDYDYNGLENLVKEINPRVIICSGWIDKDYLKILVQKINLLETNPESGSLDLKTIHNFSRFRINDSFRALFFPKGNIKEFFAFGEHDLHL